MDEMKTLPAAPAATAAITANRTTLRKLSRVFAAGSWIALAYYAVVIAFNWTQAVKLGQFDNAMMLAVTVFTVYSLLLAAMFYFTFTWISQITLLAIELADGKKN